MLSPCFVDAAYMNYPTTIMHGYLRAGAEPPLLQRKIFLGTQTPAASSADAATSSKPWPASISLVRESGQFLTFGRPFKLDRHTIVATVTALEEWFAMDHNARWSSYAAKVASMRGQLADLKHIKTAARYFTMDERLVDEPVSCMTIEFKGGAAEVERICAELLSGEPSIATVPLDDKLVIAVDTLLADQHDQIASRLRELLGTQTLIRRSSTSSNTRHALIALIEETHRSSKPAP